MSAGRRAPSGMPVAIVIAAVVLAWAGVIVAAMFVMPAAVPHLIIWPLVLVWLATLG